MNRKKKLAAILISLVLVLIIGRVLKSDRKQEQDLPLQQQQPAQQRTSPSAVKLPQLEDFEEEEQVILEEEEEQEAAAEVQRLEDVPLGAQEIKKLTQKEEQTLKEAEQTEQDRLNTQPTVNELRELQRKGLIIF